MDQEMADASESPGAGGPGPLGWVGRVVLGRGQARNVGGRERLVRYLAGAALSAFGVYLLAFPVIGSFLLDLLLALAVFGGGLYLIYEARVQYCPWNEAIGRNSYRGDEE